MQKIKICIIKLDGMGDVLRTTPILWHFQDDEVTWITEKASLPLLEGNRFIKKIIPISEIPGIKDLAFDELYNFDEDRKACLLATEIIAKKKLAGSKKRNCSILFKKKQVITKQA